MGYVPGSHKHGGLGAVPLGQAPGHGILDDPALAGGPGPVFVEAAAGSVVWHHGDTVHLARPVAPGQDARKAFTIVYIADGYERAQPRCDSDPIVATFFSSCYSFCSTTFQLFVPFALRFVSS